MATLTGNTIASTYTGLLSVTGAVGADTVEAVTDGAGTSTSLSLSQQRATITLGSGAADDFIVDGTTLVVEGDNNKVGIGTASPSSYNSNTNNLVIRDSGSGGITISTGASNTGFLAFNDGEDTTIEGLIGYNQSNDVMSFRTASTDDRLIIDGTGNIGIGDNAPATKLDVNGDIQIQGANAMILNHTTGAASDTYINSPSSDVMGFRTGGTQRFALDNNSVISLSNNDSGSSNTIFGKSAADSLDAGSNFNVFIGQSVATGSLDDASDNVAIGFESMKAIIQGDDNVALGMRTLLDLEDGSNNTAIGDSVLRAVVDASDNTAVGAFAMDATTTGNNNVAMGKNALGNTADVDKCVAIGSAAMSQSNITSAADGTVGVGYFALGNLTTGGNNVAIGNSAMIGHTTGNRNIAIGRDAMGDTDAGTDSASSSDNVFIGMQAGGGAWVNTTCEYNIAIGSYALDAQLNDADANICMGYNALTALTSGDANVAFGHQVGTSVSSGTSNVLIGYQAGTDTVALSTGSNNVCIGTNTRTSANDGQHQIVIGHNISGTGNEDFAFGKASNVVSNDFDADADWSRSSDVRLKRNIQDLNLGLDFINDLRPVSFQWKPSNEVPKEMASEYNKENQKNLEYLNHGFIAQEIKEAIDKHNSPKFGAWHIDKSDNETQRVKKNMFIMPLIKAVQELTAKVEELETKLNNKES